MVVKVMMICNTDGALYVFRRPIIEALLDRGVRVSTVSGVSTYMDDLEKMGVDARGVEFPRHSVSLLSNARLLFKLVGCIRSEAPDIVHCFTHKAAILGTLAAKICKVKKIFVTVTGLGTLYAKDSLRNRVLRHALRLQYRFAMRFASVVFFQNPDDREEFIASKIIQQGKVRLTAGSGVDSSAIRPATEHQRAGARDLLAAETGPLDESILVVLLPARAVAEKGVAEFYKAAMQINENHGERYRFVHIGLIDDLSRGAFSGANIRKTARKHGVHFLGFKDNVIDYLSASDIVTLPSYREGMPRSLLEALALGKIIVATDAPGCRETVRDGWNGFLCVPGDSASLANAISKAAKLGKVAGRRSRELAEEKFDNRLLVDLTLAEYGIHWG